jgi:hypothetical protein
MHEPLHSALRPPEWSLVCLRTPKPSLAVFMPPYDYRNLIDGRRAQTEERRQPVWSKVDADTDRPIGKQTARLYTG